MTILVVEDELKLNRMLCDYLASLGYETVSTTTGHEALKMYRQHKVDLIVLDLMLPGLDGLDVTRRIREASLVPIIILTARSQEADKLIGLELGADDYMVKPFSLKELAARIRAVSRRAKQQQNPDVEDKESLIIYKDLAMDLSKRKLARHGESIALTHVQFDVLKKMLQNPGRVFTRLELLKTIQQEEAYEGYERTIDVHIKNIRKVLERDPSRPRYLETVWGVGYRIAE